MNDYAQAATELTTIKDLLRWATSRFNEVGIYFGHGTDNAWDEAVALVLRGLHLSYDDYPNVLDAKLTSKERLRLMDLLQKRIEERMPLAYLLQEAWFAGLKFYVDQRVLIPRSPIAELIEQQFLPWLEPDSVEQILDLCCGSACIAIACAVAFPDAQVDAVDIDADALAVAHKNVAYHQLEEQLRLYQGDLFYPLANKRYNLIVSNPPYVSGSEMQALPAEYRQEPSLALEAKEDGLAIALQILRQASVYLAEDGILVVEVGNSEKALVDRFPQVPFTWLDFARGGEGVFLLTAAQLRQFQAVFEQG
jgi:ribosomal protein L3 glutamine methyltransferase